MQPIGVHGGEVMYFESFCFRDELGFMNCNDICVRVVNKQFELLEFVFDSVYVDLKYNEIMRGLGIGFTNTVGTEGVLDVCLCLGCGSVGGVEERWLSLASLYFHF